MSLSYEKLKKKQEDPGSFWTSYADMATVNSVLFLLLYALATMRSSTISVSKQIDLQRQKEAVEKLQQQVKMYEVLKDGYLAKNASPEEKKAYEDVLSQMKLLEDDAKKTKEDSLALAKESAKKEEGLNHYQALIKNIIGANVIAQSKLKQKDQIIGQKREDIAKLHEQVFLREKLINDNKREIKAIENKLSRSIASVRASEKARMQSKRSANAEIARLRSESSKKISSLESKNRQAEKQLNNTKAALSATNKRLSNSNNQVLSLEKENQQIMNDLIRQALSYKHAIKDLEAEYQARKIEKGNFEAKVQALNGQLDSTRNAIKENERQYKGAIQELSSAKGGLERELAALQKRDNDRKKLAKDIKASFANSGINADINPKSGEVTIHFGQEYFDYDKSELKGGMMQILNKAIPLYANSLFKDKKISEKIASVELIGFASPTYHGKYVDPKALDPEARAAVNYNMDLSYRRAKAMFEYIFNTKQFKYQHQKELLGLTKVAGLGYLKTKSTPSESMTDETYCEKYDCAKSQKVIIKFNFSENIGE